MSSKAGIKSAIEGHVGTNYSSWRIGLTHDWTQRKQEWKDDGKDVTYWHVWEAESLTDAQNLESHFIALGLKGGTGGNLSERKTVYVYIF